MLTHGKCTLAHADVLSCNAFKRNFPARYLVVDGSRERTFWSCRLPHCALARAGLAQTSAASVLSTSLLQAQSFRSFLSSFAILLVHLCSLLFVAIIQTRNRLLAQFVSSVRLPCGFVVSEVRRF